jgi:FSR family fosmidomycin resistance protein-like MFS transporter
MTNRIGVALVSAAHLVDDVYQGVVPAMLPFFVSERHYGYAAVAGLVLGSSLLSSIAQPLFGWWTDRRPRRWMIALGMLTAAAGVVVAGLATEYAVTFVALAVSGLGVAAFHPEGARAARQAAGDSARAMSVFALGGNIGFALGPLLATPILLAVGLRGTVLLGIPVIVMAAILVARLGRVLDGTAERPRATVLPTGTDDWPTFRWLTSVVVVRSIMFFGLTSFLALYFIDDLGASQAEGGAALTAFLFAGAVGTVAGGWLADRRGRLVTIRLGFLVVVPALLGLLLAPTQLVAMAFVVATGFTLFVPFSVFVVLGQDYLPHRIGTASGVTVGLAVGVGGLASPVLGWVAESLGLHATLALLLPLPIVALLLSTRLLEPSRRGREAATQTGRAD